MAPAPKPAETDPPMLAFVDAGLSWDSAAARSPDPMLDAGECDDQLRGELARESCDGERVLIAKNVAFHPSRPAPADPERSVLADVARVMRTHPEILLLRIEVYTSATPKYVEEQRSELEQAQLRATAIFLWLWRHEKIWAERLEAVGYAHDEKISRADPSRWPVVLRIVQRRK
jgi:hypothetical protein